MGTSRPLEVAVDWQSPHARHRDRTFLGNVDLQQARLPGLAEQQPGSMNQGESASVELRFDDWLTGYRPDRITSLRREQFRRRSRHPLPPVVPRVGRFYPRRFVSDVPSVDMQEPWPLRCLDVDDERLVIDLNHPMAGRSLALTATVLQETAQAAGNTKQAGDLLHEATLDGPGMQAALPDVDTDFFTEHAFRRMDESPDTEFYASPRLVQHLDETCRAHIRELYSRFLHPGMQVLDLMSSWVSHLPDAPEDIEVHGLGLNREELQANPRLADYLCQDLNRQVSLPYRDGCFDAALCSASIEYLIQPVEVMRELARVLKPGAPLVITFSDRWFPPKAIELWSELHSYERLGLVIDYFRFSDGFRALETESLRGYPRPAEDPYRDRLDYADPLFAVWGYNKC